MDRISKYKTFCIIPYTRLHSLNNCDYRACCHTEPGLPNANGDPTNMFTDKFEDVWNNEYFQQLRLDMVNGVANKTCDVCWKMESQNEYSFREKYNLDHTEEELEYFFNETLEKNGLTDAIPSSIQIKIGNLCNLKCIMCNQASSNLIQKEIIKWQKKEEIIPKWLDWVEGHEIDWTGLTPENFEVFYSMMRTGLIATKQIQIVGGEPLVNHATTMLMERLIDEGVAHNIGIYIISNLTTLPPKIIKLLSQFKYAAISVSWDHVDPEKFRFIRFPARYDHFKKNINTLHFKTTIEPKISCTLNIFNIYDIESIFDEFEKTRKGRSHYTVNIQFVENPNYFSIRYLEKEQKEEIIKIVEQYLEKSKDYLIWKDLPASYNQLLTIKEQLASTLDNFEEVVIERTRVLKMYDKARDTDYKSLFPFIKDYE